MYERSFLSKPTEGNGKSSSAACRDKKASDSPKLLDKPLLLMLLLEYHPPGRGCSLCESLHQAVYRTRC